MDGGAKILSKLIVQTFIALFLLLSMRMSEYLVDEDLLWLFMQYYQKTWKTNKKTEICLDARLAVESYKFLTREILLQIYPEDFHFHASGSRNSYFC